MGLVLAFLLWLSAPTTFAQSRDVRQRCNEKMTFCWYPDEVDAWGSLWKTDDPTEKSLQEVTEVRCVKRLNVCIKARNQQNPAAASSSLTNIDLFNVRMWNDTKIEAVMDEQVTPECEQDLLVMNRAERSAIIISSPGPRGDEKHCKDFMGPPKTVVYRLTEQKQSTGRDPAP